jgi:hypothetical protein
MHDVCWVATYASAADTCCEACCSCNNVGQAYTAHISQSLQHYLDCKLQLSMCEHEQLYMLVISDMLLKCAYSACNTGVILGTFVLSYMGNSAINFIMTNGNKLLARYAFAVLILPKHESHSMKV